MINPTWLAFKKDVLRWKRDPVGLLLWAAIPLAIVLLMKVAFGGANSVPVAKLLWVDQDQTLVSNALRSAFGQDQISDLIETVTVDSTEAWQMLGAGKASAIAVIPAGFASDYFNGRRPRIELIKNPSQTILPKIVEETFAVLVDGASYLQFVFDEPIQTLRTLIEQDMAAPDSTALALSQGIGDPMGEIAGYLFPPLIELEMNAGAKKSAIDVDGAGASGDSAPGTSASASDADAPATTPAPKKSIGYLELFFPGVLLMSMLFVAQNLALDFWAEDRNGTFARSLSAATGGSGFVLGKTLAGVLLLTLIFVALLLIGRFLLGLHLENILVAALYLGVCSFGFVATINLICISAKSQKGATVLMNLVVMPLVILGGSFFPLESMPDGLRSIGELTPNGFVGEQLKTILFAREFSPTVVWVPIVAAALGFVFVSVAQLRMRRRFVGN